MKKISIVFLSLLIILSLVGCSSPSSDKAGQQTKNNANQESDPMVSESEQQAETGSSDNGPGFSGEAPRTDTPMFPGAELIYEKEYEIAAEEVYATDAAVPDVIAFYGEYPQFESILTTKSAYTHEEGVYFQTPLMSLLKRGDPLQEEVNTSGPLLYIMIARSDCDMLGLLGSQIVDGLPDNMTIISLRILTEY